MAENVASEQVSQVAQPPLRLPLRAWVRANALGLGVTFALFALVGGTIEAMGADHDSVARNVPAITAMVLGGTVFALLRRKVLGTLHTGPTWQALAIGACIAAGFAVGAVAIPLDFVLAIVVAGAIGGALQLRALRGRLVNSSRLVLVGAASWLVAAMVAIAAVVLVADVVIDGVLGLGGALDGVAGFVAMFTLIGLVGGAVGGAVEGSALRRRMGRAGTTGRP